MNKSNGYWKKSIRELVDYSVIAAYLAYTRSQAQALTKIG